MPGFGRAPLAWLDRRIPHQAKLEREVVARLDRRNTLHRKLLAQVSWRFTTAGTRSTLKKLSTRIIADPRQKA